MRRLSRQIGSPDDKTWTRTWTIDKTTTYSAGTPAAGATDWGTDNEDRDLDRKLSAVGSAKTGCLGYLATFVVQADDYHGAAIKIQPTYASNEDPYMELWTYNALTATWTQRRRVRLSSYIRSGDTAVLDLRIVDGLTAWDDQTKAPIITKVWITMVPDGTSALDWLCVHHYGECDVDIDYGNGTDPCHDQAFKDANPILCPDASCDDVDRISGNCKDDPWSLSIPVIIPVRNPDASWFTYPLPGEDWRYGYKCPAPNRIYMEFPEDPENPGSFPGNASVTVEVVSVGFQGEFTEGDSQTIVAPGVLEWTLKDGTGYPAVATSPSIVYTLPPRSLVENTIFKATITWNTLNFDLLDVVYLVPLAWVQTEDVC